MSDELTPAVEDYVREIYKLQHEHGRATTSALAERMGVSAPSATGMIKRLASLSLVEHERYRGVVLTRAGEKKAIELIRHHRLLEQYLAEALGLPIDAVHAEADRLEHALSEEVEARIDASLGYPTHDPHGDPIPDARLRVAASSHGTLAALGVGDSAIVRRIPDGDPQVVRYLASMQLLPSRAVEVVESAPFDGPLTIVVAGTRHAVSRELALQIHVG